MRRLSIKRKRKLAGAALPYWIITNISKNDFMNKYSLNGDMCETFIGQPIPRIDILTLDSVGVRISNGQTVEIELDDGVETVFACTAHGCLSNEIILDDFLTEKGYYEICLSTKGGFKNLSYPYFEK